MSDQGHTEQTGPELQVRSMVMDKLLFVHKVKNKPVTKPELEAEINEVMGMSKKQILAFLQRPFNWVLDSKASWDELPLAVQQVSTILGYNEDLWDGAELPAVCDKFFDDLTPDQRKAAIFLGYTKAQWDGAGSAPLKPIDKMKDSLDALPRENLRRVVVDDDSSGDSGSGSGLEASDSDDLQTDGPFKDYNAEVIMMQKVRELVTMKFQIELSIDDPNDSVLEGAINEVMNLPKEQIKKFLQLPLLPPQSAKAEEESVPAEPSEVDEEEDEFLSNFLGVEPKPKAEVSESNETSSSSKEPEFANQLETFLHLWAFDTPTGATSNDV